MTQSVEDLLDELSRKDQELVLAASYGKTLLEEKEQLREQLRAAQEEIKQLEESLQSLRHSSQRALNQAKAEADELLIDLQSRLHTANRSLEEEQVRHKNTKEEYQKRLTSLHTENSKLHVEITLLSKEKRSEKDRVRKVSDALKQSEVESQVASLQREELETLVEALQGENRSYSEDILSLTHTCDKLSEELHTTRAEVENWELKYSHLNDKLHGQHKELADSQQILKQLEAELDQQRSTAGSPTSTMSLHDELSQSMSSLDLIPDSLSPHELEEEDIPESLQPLPGDRVEQLGRMRSLDIVSRASTLRRPSDQSVMSTLRASDHPHVMMWSSSSDPNSPQFCSRCEKANEEMAELRRELSVISDQLLLAVRQKIRLLEQNEAWQSDMAELVDQNLHQKLEQETPTNTPKRHRKSTAVSSLQRNMRTGTLNKENSVDIFRREFIKNSWYF